MSDDPKPPSRLRNLTVVAAAGQAGFGTVIIVVVALLLGLWLDSLFGLRGPFTIGLVVLSVPVSLVVMVRSVFAVTRAIRLPERPAADTPPTTVKED